MLKAALAGSRISKKHVTSKQRTLDVLVEVTVLKFQVPTRLFR